MIANVEDLRKGFCVGGPSMLRGYMIDSYIV